MSVFKTSPESTFMTSDAKRKAFDAEWQANEK